MILLTPPRRAPLRVTFVRMLAFLFACALLTCARAAEPMKAEPKPAELKPAAKPEPALTTAAAEQLFAGEVLPLLKQKCFACHGEDAKKIEGKLDLRSRDAMLQGGESGEASLVPGKAKQSALVRAIRWQDLEMPPKENDRLTEPQIAAIERWIDAGAPWPSAERLAELRAKHDQQANPRGVVVKTSGGLSADWTERRYQPEDLWAYQPLSQPAVPGTTQDKPASDKTGPEKSVPEKSAPDQSAGVNPIDAFVARELQARKLSPAPRADRRTLARRLYYDLLGLPPTPVQLAAFVADERPDAYARLVDELLAREEYGERMAQHWFDVVRYADTNGFSRDEFREEAWKYRDYVMQAFNSDKPYDQFVREQIAADELAAENPQAALGFLWTGPWEHTSMSVSAETRQLWLDDVTNSVGVTFLAHELRCAKCHDHKFDPVPTRDYYRIQAVFASTIHNKGFPKGPAPVKAEYEIRAQTPQPIHILLGGGLANLGDAVTPGILSAAVLVPSKSELSETEQGKNAQSKTEASKSEPSKTEPTIPEEQTGRRRALAEWLTHPDNPLTARVMANRVWQMHFGRGLVATSNNFGKTGSKPTHPELLDWLARYLQDQQWSVKQLHRLIVTSETYTRASAPADPASVARLDPENRWLSHFNPRRLTAEELRDSMLLMAGELNGKHGGPSNFPEINWDVAFQPRLKMGRIYEPYQPDTRRADRNRRSLYAVKIRGQGNPLFEALNLPTTELSCERRDETTVSTQALTLLHGEFSQDRALAVAHRITSATKEPAEQVRRAFAELYAREPDAREAALGLAHLQKLAALDRDLKLEPKTVPTKITLASVAEKTGQPEEITFELPKLVNYEQDPQPWEVDAATRSLANLCLVLFNSSEYLYVY